MGLIISAMIIGAAMLMNIESRFIILLGYKAEEKVSSRIPGESGPGAVLHL